MLKRCHKIWAKKVVKVELKENSVPTSKPLLSATFQQQLDAIDSKINLLCEVAHIKEQRSGMHTGAFKAKWDEYQTRINELKKDYEKGVKNKFESIDMGIAELWAQAYGQLKQENRNIVVKSVLENTSDDEE
jgi:hypothetical protein